MARKKKQASALGAIGAIAAGGAMSSLQQKGFPSHVYRTTKRAIVKPAKFLGRGAKALITAPSRGKSMAEAMGVPKKTVRKLQPYFGVSSKKK